MKERYMALATGTSEGTIQKAINTLNAAGQAYADHFGEFSTSKIKVMEAGTFGSRRSAKSTPYIRLAVKTTSEAAFDALFDELGGIDLGGLDYEE